MDFSKLVAADSPLYVVGLVAFLCYQQRQIIGLRKEVKVLQAVHVQLSGVHLAVTNCPVAECKLKNITPLPSVTQVEAL